MDKISKFRRYGRDASDQKKTRAAFLVSRVVQLLGLTLSNMAEKQIAGIVFAQPDHWLDI